MELKPNGGSVMVDDSNRGEYVSPLREFTCGASHFASIIEAFVRGFDSVFPWSSLRSLSPAEIGTLLSGEKMLFTEDDLASNVVPSSGYDAESREFQWFKELAQSMSPDEKQELLQFVTGFVQVPIGGMASLSPKITVGKREPQSEPADLALPTASVCMNCLRFPPYSSPEIMKAKLLTAIHDGQGSVQLS